MSDPLVSRLQQDLPDPVTLGRSLAEACTFRLGGAARYFCAPSSVEGVRKLWLAAQASGIPVWVLGGGSNVLFSDQGYAGLVISTRGLRSMEMTPPNQVRVQAGCTNADLTEMTRRQDWTGFEWAAGLPGTVGGGVFMNARCYGGSYEQRVSEVTAMLPDGSLRSFPLSACGFGYKDSVFQRHGWLITEVVLRLTPGDPAAIGQHTRQILDDRRRKGQFLFPSAGCIFKNDHQVGVPAGRLIEECGLKGYRIGGAKVYERHANFIVNTGTATAREVLDLIKFVQRTVLEQKGVHLEPEVRRVEG